jgi:hypothetical protein
VKHHTLLGVTTEADYLARADAFLGGPCPADVLECFRKSDGDRLRFRVSTQEFGVCKPNGVIRTYYVRTPGTMDETWFWRKCAA